MAPGVVGSIPIGHPKHLPRHRPSSFRGARASGEPKGGRVRLSSLAPALGHTVDSARSSTNRRSGLGSFSPRMLAGGALWPCANARTPGVARALHITTGMSADELGFAEQVRRRLAAARRLLRRAGSTSNSRTRKSKELAAAEARLDAGTYGFCERCRRPIALARLRALPTARRCSRCVSGKGRYA